MRQAAGVGGGVVGERGVGGLRIDASRVWLVFLVDYEILEYLKLEQAMDGVRF